MVRCGGYLFLSFLSLCVSQSCENVRKSLEKCDVDADIDLFLKEKATGGARPIAVKYINYYHPSDSLEGSGEGYNRFNP